MRNSFLISFIVLSALSCTTRVKFRQDKIEFSDRKSKAELEATNKVVVEILAQDTCYIKHSQRGCTESSFFRNSIIVTNIDDSFQLSYNEVCAFNSKDGFFVYKPTGGVGLFVSDKQKDTLIQLFTKYGNREYKMHSTVSQTYELVGSDTSITIENFYTFEGTPFCNLNKMLDTKRINKLAVERSLDTTAFDIFWTSF